jgi:NTE family protein
MSSNNSIALNNESINRFTKVSLSYEKRIPLHKSTSAIISGSTNFTFIDKLKSNKLPFEAFDLGANYFLGGYLRSPRENSLVFPGLNENDVPASQIIKFHLKFQTNPFHNFYISPHINYASIGFSEFNEYIKDAFLPKGNWSEAYETSSLFSFGTTVSYDSILGPVNLDVSFVNDIGKVRAFFGAGLFLNLSD